MKLVANNKEDVASSLLADKKHDIGKLADKVQLDSRVYSEYNLEIKELAQQWFGVGLRFHVLVDGKPDTCMSAMTNMIVKLGIDAVKEMLSKQQQSTSYATSRRSGFRADKTSRLMEMHTLFKTWNTGASRSNYPVFHLNVIHDIIKQVCKKSDITDNRTMFTSREPPSYRKIIIDLSKEVGTSMFDITGFMKRYDRS